MFNVMKTVVIIPTYNECKNVRTAVIGLRSAAPFVDIVIVDDASPDGTGDIADELAREYRDHVFVLHRAKKSGLGSAYIDGFRSVRDRGYEVFCEMDADGSHDPNTLPALLQTAEQGADVVIGSRRVSGGRIVGWGIGRHVMSRLAMIISRAALDIHTRDVPSGFRCYRAHVVEKILALSLRSCGYAFQEEILAYCERWGCVIAEVPIMFRERRYGVSKLSWLEAVEFLQVMWLVRKDLKDFSAKKVQK